MGILCLLPCLFYFDISGILVMNFWAIALLYLIDRDVFRLSSPIVIHTEDARVAYLIGTNRVAL